MPNIISELTEVEEFPFVDEEEVLDILGRYFQQSALVRRTDHPSWF